MEVKQKYSIIKDAKTDVITYKEYENLKGFKTKPKKSFKSEDMVNVSKMIVINPSLIEKLVDKKCKRNLERILKMLTIIYEDDEFKQEKSITIAFVGDERICDGYYYASSFKMLIISRL